MCIFSLTRRIHERELKTYYCLVLSHHQIITHSQDTCKGAAIPHEEGYAGSILKWGCYGVSNYLLLALSLLSKRCSTKATKDTVTARARCGSTSPERGVLPLGKWGQSWKVLRCGGSVMEGVLLMIISKNIHRVALKRGCEEHSTLCTTPTRRDAVVCVAWWIVVSLMRTWRKMCGCWAQDIHCCNSWGSGMLLMRLIGWIRVLITTSD